MNAQALSPPQYDPATLTHHMCWIRLRPKDEEDLIIFKTQLLGMQVLPDRSLRYSILLASLKVGWNQHYGPKSQVRVTDVYTPEALVYVPEHGWHLEAVLSRREPSCINPKELGHALSFICEVAPIN